MKKLLFTLAALLAVIAVNAKTLIVYYSYTNNVERIVAELRNQIDADVVEIQPAVKGLDYAANNYAIGSEQIAAIRNNPHDAASYPAIDPVSVDLSAYDCIIIGAPLWWSNMAAPLQTYLFQNGHLMGGKKIGLIVSSASSGISGVESDARRLVPDGDFISPSLWIRSSQTSNCRAMISDWLRQIDYDRISSGVAPIHASLAPTLTLKAGEIHIDGDFESFELYNLSGRRILEATLSPIAVSPGLYVAKLKTPTRNITKKIAVANNL